MLEEKHETLEEKHKILEEKYDDMSRSVDKFFSFYKTNYSSFRETCKFWVTNFSDMCLDM